MSEPDAKTLPPDADDELITLRDAATTLGVSDETFRRWIRKGAVAFVMVGPSRLKRVTKSELKKHIVAGESGK